MASIAVTSSGGGYRAAIFGLGVLLYLVDAGKNREVTSISSVSGGSITNAFVAQLHGYHRRTSPDFWPAVAPLAKTTAHKTLWLTPITWAYLTLLRGIGIMYDNSSSLRMQALVQQFRSRQHLVGALVYIEQRPYDIPEAYAKGDSPSSRRAHAVLKRLRDSQAEWRAISRQNMRVKTTLSRLGPEVTARLLRHGYVLAMANLHVVLDFPLVEIPETAKFMELVTSSKDPM